jgi:Domain of unknown function (DUF397)
MNTSEPTNLAWRKSSYSGSATQQCVEVATVVTGSVTVRDTKDADGPTLQFTLPEWAAFLAGVRDGEFDLHHALPVPSRQPQLSPCGDQGAIVASRSSGATIAP